MPPDSKAIESLKVWKVTGAGRRAELDSIVREVEVVIRLDDTDHRRLCCLPTHLEELARGYLLSEGISPTAEIAVEHRGGEISICAKRGSAAPAPEVISSGLKISEEDVFDFTERLNENSLLHAKTGGTHVVGIFKRPEALFVEDISRHCAIDKAIGLALKKGIDLSQSVLVTSCRQTLSTIKKAIHAQIPIVISISAVTDLAIDRADLFGITLVGFARERQFSIYCHEWRILTAQR